MRGAAKASSVISGGASTFWPSARTLILSNVCSVAVSDNLAEQELSAPDAPLDVDAQSPPLSLGELESEIRELGAHIAAATCRWLTLIAEFDERRGWAADGIKSCAHWLSWRCSIGLGTAREHVRVAARLRELPLVREAFFRGQLSFCKVRAITRIASVETESELLELARHATGAQLEKIVRGFCRAQRATLEQARQAHERRFLSWNWEEDGSLSFEGRLPAEDGALLLAALTAAEGPALAGVARAALAFGKTRRSGADPVELVVHVDAGTLAAERISERCELYDGPALAPETARRLGCDAAVTRIVERDGRPLSISRRTRTIPPALRRALRARDSGCRFPGCTHNRFLHAHHIHHWARGGETKLENLIHLCSYHHRLVHEGGFTVERRGSGGLRFRRPDGREIAPAGGYRPAAGCGCAEQNRALGLHIDGNTWAPLSAGGRLDYSIAVECLLAKTPAPP